MNCARIVVIGSANTDMIIKTSRIPRPGETVTGGIFSTAAGGKGANQAVAARRLGAEVAFVSAVGHDSFGDLAIQGYVAEGIKVQHIVRDPVARTGVAFIIVDEHGENSIAVVPGANNMLSAAHVVASLHTIEQADMVILQLETPLATVNAAIDCAMKKGIKVVLNPAPAPVNLPDSMLAHVDILTPNEWEAQTLTGIPVTDNASAHRAGQALLAKGVAIVIITMGAAGAWLETQEGGEHIAGYSVQAIDTTAAGDVFNAAVAVALAEKKELKEAVRFANAAAAISVTRLGAQPSAPGRKEVENLLGG
jgi:ribokinase